MRRDLLNGVTTRRTALKALGAAALSTAPGMIRYAQSASSEPIKIGVPIHRTGIGASYGRWFERTTNAAVKLINSQGGINGRPIQLFIEDDGTDPKRGMEVIEKFGTEYKVDVICNHLFSHVVVACAPRVAELKIPYLVTTEGTQIPAGRAQPLCVPGGYYGRPGTSNRRGSLDRLQSRQKDHHHLPGHTLRARSPRFLFGGDQSAGRRRTAVNTHSRYRNVIHPIFSADSIID